MELESHGVCDANNAVFTSADAAASGVLLRKFGAGGRPRIEGDMHDAGPCNA